MIGSARMWRVSLLFLGACSFAVMPPPHAITSVCNTGYQAPLTDTIVGATVLATTLGLGVLAKSHDFGEEAKAGYWLVLVPTAVLFSSSAAYGYLSRHRCEHLRDDSPSASSATRRAANG